MIKWIYYHLTVDLFYKTQLALIDIGEIEGKEAVIFKELSIEQFLCKMDDNYLLYLKNVSTGPEMQKEYRLLKALYRECKRYRNDILRNL